MFFGAMILWLIMAVVIGLKAPKWLGVRHHSAILAIAVGVTVFFLPVLDEVMAYPQLKRLCEDGATLTLSPTVGTRTLAGVKVKARYTTSTARIFPGTVVLAKYQWSYIDATTDELIASSSSYSPVSAMLSLPAGSSGGVMTLLLKSCSSQGHSITNELKKRGLTVVT